MKAFLRSYWPALSISAVFAGLTINVWVHDGAWPVLVIFGVALGGVLVLGAVGLFTGAQVVKHSRREAAAIGSGNHPMKELTR